MLFHWKTQIATRILFLLGIFIVVHAEYFGTLSPVANPPCTLPRVRKCWSLLTTQEQQNYINSVLMLKNLSSGFDAYDGNGDISWQDLFVRLHSSNCWHTNSFFLPIHRFFLWKYECALQWAARQIPSITDPCSVTIPYWNYEVDYKNLNNTSIFVPPNFFGPPPPATLTNVVTSGSFANWTEPEASGGPKILSRDFVSSGILTANDAPGNLMLNIAQIPNYLNFSQDGCVANLHSLIHIWVGGTMGLVSSSPGDPVFYSHHANIDRVWATWQECHNYTKVNASEIVANSSMYYAWVTNPIPQCAGLTFDLDSPMPWTITPSWSTLDKMLPSEPLTPRSCYFLGSAEEPSYDGMYVVYAAPDFIAEYLSEGNNGNSFCNNTDGFQTVNYNATSTKRSLLGVQSNTTEQTALATLAEQFENAQRMGLTGLKILEYVADAECNSTPKVEVNDKLLMWVLMEGSELSWYDSRCDSPSVRFCAARPNHIMCQPKGEKYYKIFGHEVSSNTVAVAISIMEGIVIFVLFVLVVVLYKKQQPTSDIPYSSL